MGIQSSACCFGRSAAHAHSRILGQQCQTAAQDTMSVKWFFNGLLAHSTVLRAGSYPKLAYPVVQKTGENVNCIQREREGPMCGKQGPPRRRSNCALPARLATKR